MQTDGIKNIMIVAIGVCLICSVLVAGAAVSLSGIQNENRKLDKLKNILMAGNLMEEGIDIEKTFHEKIQAVLVDLSTGEVVPEEKRVGLLNLETFDIAKVSADPEFGTSIPSKEDIASIKRKPKFMPVYLVKEGETLKNIILPVYGKGLWSTMYGFVSIENDFKTASGITFYQHGETPGLGGEVDNARWKASWAGKQLMDENGKVVLDVIKGAVDKSSPKANMQIDGLSGATITTRGVDYLIDYWLSDTGYGKYLSKLKSNLQTEVNQNG